MKLNKVAQIKDRMVEAMMQANKTQADLVRETGLNRGTISKYISGKVEPKSDSIYKLAKSLNCSEAWLIGYDVPMKREKKDSQDKIELTEGEKGLLELFNLVPEDQQQLVLDMIKIALKNRKQQ